MSGRLGGKTFLLGVGAQKAGTTWFHDYLVTRREVFLPPVKELHYFDAKFRPDLCSRYDKAFERRLAKHLSEGWSWPFGSRARRLDCLKSRVRMTTDASAYMDYFQRNVPARCRVFGEITPSYSLLREDGFREIARRFERIKIVFLLRDPVDRFHSSIRASATGGRASGAMEERFMTELDDPVRIERTLYHLTLNSLRAVFAEKDIFIGFYETFFCDAEIGRLCSFLDIPFAPGSYGIVSNASPEAALDPKLEAMAREKFAPVYDFCRREFGARLPDSWHE